MDTELIKNLLDSIKTAIAHENGLNTFAGYIDSAYHELNNYSQKKKEEKIKKLEKNGTEVITVDVDDYTEFYRNYLKHDWVVISMPHIHQYKLYKSTPMNFEDYEIHCFIQSAASENYGEFIHRILNAGWEIFEIDKHDYQSIVTGRRKRNYNKYDYKDIKHIIDKNDPYCNDNTYIDEISELRKQGYNQSSSFIMDGIETIVMKRARL